LILGGSSVPVFTHPRREPARFDPFGEGAGT
jgi:hypothetical protein